MSIYDRLASSSSPVTVSPESTSYFSEPTEDLDPFLFAGDHLRSNIRQAVNSLVLSFLKQEWSEPESWSTIWIAGSGVSHQWSAARDPGDLDVLIGVDMITFRRANRDLANLSDQEIAGMINGHFRDCLSPLQHDWNGYDLTMYVNADAKDITSINPYAAYDVTHDEWTVRPEEHPAPPHNPDWERRAGGDSTRAQQIVERYDRALQAVTLATNPGARLNLEGDLRVASQQAVDLFDEIHEGRHAAFTPGGLGYGDWANYRWQAGKSSGAIQALKQVKDDLSAATGQENTSLYGRAIPSAKDTLVASAISRRYKP
jgi:hypothetical protein